MDDEQAGFFAGFVLCALLIVLWWHTAESRCQKKHNVHDCVMSTPIFIPRKENPNDE